MKRLTAILLVLLLAAGCRGQVPPATAVQPLRTGADMLLAADSLFAAGGTLCPGRHIAVVGNHTSLVGTTHLVDTLLAKGLSVVRIFCPEHGFRGTAAAGAAVADGLDPSTGLPIVSLYGKNKKPTPTQMDGIDVVLFDLQDVGCRFYTYLSTLHYVMEACAERGIPLLVLDRPNPNGHYVDGPVLDPQFKSFVGMHPVPVVYGMTIGEYAAMVNGEHWLADSITCRLRIIAMEGYRRDSTGYVLPVPPSPNLRNSHAIALYPSLCLFEGTTISVGRGTPYPFEIIGNATDTMDLRHATAPHRFELRYLMEMYRRTPSGKFFLKNNFFDKLAGTSLLRRQLQQGMSEDSIRQSWQEGLQHFMKIRSKYLIYQ